MATLYFISEGSGEIGKIDSSGSKPELVVKTGTAQMSGYGSFAIAAAGTTLTVVGLAKPLPQTDPWLSRLCLHCARPATTSGFNQADNGLVFGVPTSKDGKEDTAVALTVDHKGAIWITANNGIYVFDGLLRPVVDFDSGSDTPPLRFGDFLLFGAGPGKISVNRVVKQESRGEVRIKHLGYAQASEFRASNGNPVDMSWKASAIHARQQGSDVIVTVAWANPAAKSGLFGSQIVSCYLKDLESSRAKGTMLPEVKLLDGSSVPALGLDLQQVLGVWAEQGALVLSGHKSALHQSWVARWEYDETSKSWTKKFEYAAFGTSARQLQEA